MSRIVMLIPISTGVGLTSVSLGIIRAMEKKKINLSVFKPITQPRIDDNDDQCDNTIAIIRSHSSIDVIEPLKIGDVKKFLIANQQDQLMEEIVAKYQKYTKKASLVLIEGLIITPQYPFSHNLNYQISKTLNAEIVFVLALGNNSQDQLKQQIEIARSSFGGKKNKNITGVIINKLNAPVDNKGRTRHELYEIFYDLSKENATIIDPIKFFGKDTLPIYGCIPWNIDLIATRAIDLCRHLNARIINKGEIYTRRVTSITLCAHSLSNMLSQFRPNSLLVTSADRHDVLVASCLTAINGIEIGSILLTGGYNIDKSMKQICKCAFKTGLPIFMVETNSWQTSINLQNFCLEVPIDDYDRIEKIKNYIANYISSTWIDSLSTVSKNSYHLSPPAFRYTLTKLARQANKNIILPEGEEKRIVKAAAISTKLGIAECVLLGNPEEIHRVATTQGVILSKKIHLINPPLVRKDYVSRLVELRKSKGMTEVIARNQLEDNITLATLMLERGETFNHIKIDGLVSGVVHTTANTIRPALQFIKTSPGCSLVSSVFFMLLPEQVLVYGDCAINPDPTADQLAEIAIQSADSATLFGIHPRVAMISYSTGKSGAGSDVEKVREATFLAKKKRPDLIIDGPLQYDAAIIADVAKSKAPDSPVAGRATVFIFPDLNTGNTTYKAVQRSADLVSIGPMLQGMCKPVNDLSRGASVDEIVYTIALTAIQSNNITS